MFSPTYDCQDLSDDDVEYLDSLNKKFMNRQQLNFQAKPFNVDSNLVSLSNQNQNQLFHFNSLSNDNPYQLKDSLLGKLSQNGDATIFLQKVQQDDQQNNTPITDLQLENSLKYSTIQPKEDESKTQNLLQNDSSHLNYKNALGGADKEDSLDQVNHQTPSVQNNPNTQEEVLRNIFQPPQHSSALQDYYRRQLNQQIMASQDPKQQHNKVTVKKYKLSQNLKQQEANGSNLTQKQLKWTHQDLVYEKLSKNNKPYYIEVARLLQEMEEKRKCTFKPQVNQEGRRYQDPQEIFERLYYEKNLKEDLNQRREQIKQAKEVHGCSFTPHRITKNESQYKNPLAQSYQGKQLYEKLYQDHEYIQKNRQMKKMVLESIEQQGLTFTPQICIQSRRKSGSSNQQSLTLSQAEQQKRFESLYQDSSRRREKILKMQEENDQQISLNGKLCLQTSNQKKRCSSANREESSRQQQENEEPNLLMLESNSNSKPRYIGLYENSLQRKERLRKLEKEINHERGITFTPNKYTQMSAQDSARSPLPKSTRFNDSNSGLQDRPININDLRTAAKVTEKRNLPPKPARPSNQNVKRL